MMFPKQKRVKDRAVIKSVRKDYCERCGNPAWGGPHHIVSRGAGGPDIPENLIQLCKCHLEAHQGKISRDELLVIVARREGITVDECYRRIRTAMGYNV